MSEPVARSAGDQAPPADAGSAREEGEDWALPLPGAGAAPPPPPPVEKPVSLEDAPPASPPREEPPAAEPERTADLPAEEPVAEPPAPALPEPPVDPQDFYDYAVLSYHHMREGRGDEAWEAAQRALELGTPETDLYVPLCQQFPPERRRLLAHAAMERTPPTQDAFNWLWAEVAISYWYQGEYGEAAAEYEAILSLERLDPEFVVFLENSLGMCLEALDRQAEAEDHYMRAGNTEGAVRARARAGDVEGAVGMLRDGLGPPEPEIRDCLEATYLALLGRPIPDLDGRVDRLRDLPEEWLYKDLMRGVLLCVAGRHDEAWEPLVRFLEVCRASPKEWGVTLRWEVGIVEEIVRLLSGEEPAEAEAAEDPAGQAAAEAEPAETVEDPPSRA